MGTSQRHNPSVSGEPNWGLASQAMTQAGKDIAELEFLSEQDSLNPQQIRRVQLLNKRFHEKIGKSISHIVKASGGKTSVATGKSSAFGKRGVSYGSSLFSLLSEIKDNGLFDWLKEHGFNKESCSCEEILDYICDYIQEDGVTLDDTAANDALRLLKEKIERDVEMSGIPLDEYLKNNLSESTVKDYLDEFLGNYIYCHLSQDFTEKLEKSLGVKMTSKIYKEIRQTIINDVRNGIHGKSSIDLNWSGPEVKDFVISEFSAIINLFTDEE